jgi:hypothetical protein
MDIFSVHSFNKNMPIYTSYYCASLGPLHAVEPDSLVPDVISKGNTLPCVI